MQNLGQVWVQFNSQGLQRGNLLFCCGEATEQMNAAVFAFRRYEDASLRYTGILSHSGLTHYGLYDTVVAKD